LLFRMIAFTPTPSVKSWYWWANDWVNGLRNVDQSVHFV